MTYNSYPKKEERTFLNLNIPTHFHAGMFLKQNLITKNDCQNNLWQNNMNFDISFDISFVIDIVYYIY